MSFPYIDVAGVQLRSILRPSYFTDVEAQQAGFTAQSILANTSTVNAQMRKRYGGQLPWGQSPPLLVPAGLNPPAVTLAGKATLGSLRIAIQITTGGALGTAAFQWSTTGQAPWTSGVLTAALVTLGTTGLAALFPEGTYDTSNAYVAATPVPEVILQWLTALVTDDVAIRHGINPNDPLSTKLSERAALARQQIEQAANTKDGLWDLPVSEDAGSAVDTGGPMCYAEASPYHWTYQQQHHAHHPHWSSGARATTPACTVCSQVPCSCNSLVGN